MFCVCCLTHVFFWNNLKHIEKHEQIWKIIWNTIWTHFCFVYWKQFWTQVWNTIWNNLKNNSEKQFPDIICFNCFQRYSRVLVALNISERLVGTTLSYPSKTNRNTFLSANNWTNETIWNNIWFVFVWTMSFLHRRLKMLLFI